MASSTLPPPPKVTPSPRPLTPFAGVLSYLVPGLGQISQGRVAKGLLFLVCIYALFFYGTWLGTTSVTLGERTYRVVGNVYLPRTTKMVRDVDGREMEAEATLAENLYARPQFAGQFWLGMVVWPAIVQYKSYNAFEVRKIDRELEGLYGNLEDEVRRNDTAAAAETRQKIAERENDPQYRHPKLGDVMREPSPLTVNVIMNASDKRLELAWVYTVIAGVLNIMVIYDAVAGAAFLSTEEEKKD